MAIPTNTQTKYDTVGIREDLSDIISNISPTTTPFLSNMGKGTADSSQFDWQTDSLAAAAANATIEGDDTVAAAVTPTVRYINYTQIFKKAFTVSGTTERVKKAGRKSEIAYQTAKRGKELKRDQEKAYTGTNVAVAGNTTTARVTASFDTWLFSNDSNGTSGTQYTFSGGVPTTARTDGTDRAWSETLLKAAMLLAYNSGGEVNTLMVSPAKKQETSAFSGIAVNRYNISGAKPGVVIGAVDIYVSDFGNLEVVPNRFMPTDLVYGIDFDQVRRRTLRPYFSEELAKTGDAFKFHMIVEEGLEVTNEAAHFVVRDLS
jgi:hypothetical protein